MTPEAFLQAILDTPADDAPRLVYADWLTDQGDPRGEFIHLQCLLGRLAEDDPRRPLVQARERELLERHQDEWLGTLRPLLRRWTFRRGFLDEMAVTARAFVEQVAIPRPPTVRRVEVDLADTEVPPETVLLMPQSVARENLVFPLASRPGRLLLAMADPDRDTLQKLQFIFNSDIEAFPAPPGQVLDAIERHYGQLPPETVTETLPIFECGAINWPVSPAEPPVTQLVNLILREASQLKATEVRIEPQAERLLVLYRLDGQLVERDAPPYRLLGPIVARLRVMADLDPGGDAAQTGRIRVNVAGSFHEVTVSLTPTALGTRAVLTL
jgi:uncharacterized protein (TIGR02996 family)